MSSYRLGNLAKGLCDLMDVYCDIIDIAMDLFVFPSFGMAHVGGGNLKV